MPCIHNCQNTRHHKRSQRTLCEMENSNTSDNTALQTRWRAVNSSRGRNKISAKRIAASALLLFAPLLFGSANTCTSGPRIRWRSDGRCGPKFPLGGVGGAECNPDSDRPCCSDYGYCGNSASHCTCPDCVDFRNVIREPRCLFTLEGDSGFMISPNFPRQYPPRQECCYDVMRPSPEHCGVKLTVETLDVGRGEEEGYCQRDWLSLPSCVPETGTRICGNSTGQVYNYLFQPGASAMRFVFHAGDLSEGRTGFRIRYQLLRTCSGPYQTQNPPISSIPGTGGSPCYTRITDARGTINTPYYPKKYPENLDCIYEFMRPLCVWSEDAKCELRNGAALEDNLWRGLYGLSASSILWFSMRKNQLLLGLGLPARSNQSQVPLPLR